MNKIIELSSFKPQKNQIFLLDTNVLIKVFYPAMGGKKNAPYIALFQSIIATKATLIISSIQLSEFVNRCIRFQFDLYQKSHPNILSFKEDYRNTPDYKSSMEAILEIIENDILSCFVRVNDNFEKMNLEHILMHNFSYDFNDAIIAEISRTENAFLVTDDGDYANYLDQLSIITENRILLMFQSKH